MSQTAEVAETIEGKVLRARAVARARLDAIRERKARYDVDLEAFASDCLTLRPVGGDEVLFRFNADQRIVHEACEDQLRRTGKVRKIIVKARKIGVSTYVAGRYYQKTSRKHGRKAFVLTQIDDSTETIFGIYERFHKNNPHAPHTGTANAKELSFDELDSGIAVGTAGSKALGRGDTIQYFHGCLAEGTMIIDPAGRLRPIEMFRVGDHVRTHKNAIAPISFISQQVKRCHALVFRGLRCFPLLLTGEHRLWTRRGWAEVHDLIAGDTIGFPVRTITSETGRLAFRAAETKRPQGGGRTPNGPTVVAVDYNLGRLIGLYLAEGTVIRGSTGAKRSSAVTFTVHENEVDRTLDWLASLATLYRSVYVARRPNSKTVGVTAYGRSLAQFVDELVGHTDDKRLPDRWWTMGEDFARGMLHGYLCGDGHFSPKRDRRISATSIRETITTGMRDVMASLGYGWASIEHKVAAVRCGRNERAAFILRLTGAGVERLSVECGKPFVARRRRDGGKYGTIQVSDGYAWLPIVKKNAAGNHRVFDFEVGHADHSYCTLHGATHNSEVAIWPNAQVHATGALEAVPDVEGTEIILESTANGASGLFYNYAQAALRGQGQYEIIFLAWFTHADYQAKPPADWRPPEAFIEYAFLHKLKRPQLYWAYLKNATLAAADNKGPDEICWQFMQEFPSTAEEAFRASRAGRFISGKDVLRARKTEAADQSHAALVIGADFATGGDNEGGDANCFIDRQGRRAGRNVYDRFRDRNTVSVANKLGELITRLKPRMVFMDTGGGGAQVYDILCTRGFQSRMTLVNFGSGARNDKRYANKRAEMWGECRGWLTDPGGAQIPDDDVLDGELTAPKGKEDMNQRVLLERKDKIRKEFGTSPDGADALCLTFAEPISLEKDNTAAVAAAAAVQAADTMAGY